MKRSFLLTSLVLLIALALTGCGSAPRVGALQTESQSVDLGSDESVSVRLVLGAGDLAVTGGAEKLLEADFTYNVARLKPEVKYTGGTLVVQQPEVKGLPALQGIAGFRNEWNLRLSGKVPMDLSIDMGAGTGDLQLAGLMLTGLDVNLGAGSTTLDLRGEWNRSADIAIDSGAAEITVRLPKDVGVRVEVDRGPTIINALGLTQDGDAYTNAAYGKSDVTLRIRMQAGIGQINLEVED